MIILKKFIIIVLLLVLSFSIGLIIVSTIKENNQTQVLNGDVKDSDKSIIKLIYPDSGFEYWLIVEEELIADPSVVINELINNPNTRIPKETQLLSFEIIDNIAYVNLSKEFAELSLGDNVISANLQTIVNTLCLNEDLNIDAVQFLIEGKIEMAIGSSVGDRTYTTSIKLIDLFGYQP